ncbi:YdeI/OmpD-associated family protein [Gimesia maris]|uniref:YdeI/OmpD-associated family protein n=1 Tax=Gimesia maris TaxID=122 RepID=UPI003A940DC6
MNPDVEIYLNKARLWQEELVTLRTIVVDTPLTEEYKWRAPCYTFQKKNIVLIGAFKDNCVLSFFKGALLKDPLDILTKPGENTQAARVVRFTSLQEIIELEPVLKAYIEEAIEVEKAGLKVDVKKEAEPVPAEFQKKLDESPALQTAFAALTPGRQRAYLMHFSAAKQSQTRMNRVEKYIPQILAGKGIHDCTRGLSQKLPACDGSHKSIR